MGWSPPRCATTAGCCWCWPASSSARQRGEEAERLLEYGYNQFKNYRLFSTGEAVEQANVWLGDDTTVPLVLEEDVVVSLTAEGRRNLEVKVVYDGPIPAPVVKRLAARRARDHRARHRAACGCRWSPARRSARPACSAG